MRGTVVVLAGAPVVVVPATVVAVRRVVVSVLSWRETVVVARDCGLVVVVTAGFSPGGATRRPASAARSWETRLGRPLGAAAMAA